MTKNEKSAVVADEIPDELTNDAAPAPPPPSTLIEFPRSGRRGALPPWRKELSERVREIRQRREREAALEAEQTAPHAGETAFAAGQTAAASAHQLGLVPQTPAPEPNPIVEAALRRVERARQQHQQHYQHEQFPQTSTPHPTAHAAAAAPKREAKPAQPRASAERPSPPARTSVAAQTRPASRPKQTEAHVSAEPQRVESVSDAPVIDDAKNDAAPKVESTRASGLVAVPSPPAKEETTRKDEAAHQASPPAAAQAATAQATTSVESSAQPASAKESLAVERAAKEAGAHSKNESAVATQDIAPKATERRATKVVIDDSWLTRLEDEILPKPQTARRTPDDTAPLGRRFFAATIDLLLVAFLSSPFAAIIELTNGNWADARVAASMAGVVLVVMFLYLTGSTALAGRTWGMSLFSLHTVDADTALSPSVWQSARRTLVYMFSLATFGIGIIYAFFDAERRAAHDHLSGTVIVRE